MSTVSHMSKPFILIWPFAAGGHAAAMLNLATRLAQDFRIILAVLSHNKRKMLTWLSRSGVQYNETDVRLHVLENGHDENYNPPGGFENMMEPYMNEEVQQNFRKLVEISKVKAGENGSRLTTVMYDPFIAWIPAVANELHVKSMCYNSTSLALVTACQVYQSHGPTNKEFQLPGLQTVLRPSDAPDAFNPAIAAMFKKSGAGFIFNTSFVLEGPLHKAIEQGKLKDIQHTKSYLVGPLLPDWYCKGGEPSRSGLSPADLEALEYLDSQEKDSVLYIALGTSGAFTVEQCQKIFTILKDLGKPCLIASAASELKELRVPKNSKLVAWSPQLEVLAHPSVKGFLTHAGWNSTLEAVLAGKATICAPLFAEQLFNSKLLTYEWKGSVAWITDPPATSQLEPRPPVMKKDEEVKKIFLTFYGAEGEAAAAQMKKLREQILDKMKNKDELAALRNALLRD